jgi:hypothetical protein
LRLNSDDLLVQETVYQNILTALSEHYSFDELEDEFYMLTSLSCLIGVKPDEVSILTKAAWEIKNIWSNRIKSTTTLLQ